MKLRKKKRATKGFRKDLARRKLHELWSLAVRERDGFLCQWCLHDGRRNKNLRHHGHHIVSRSLSRTNGAFDVDNGMTLCYYCHMNRLKSEVDEYIAFRNVWLMKNVDVDYPTLRERFNGIVKFTEEYYELKRWVLAESIEFVRKEQKGCRTIN